MAYPNSSTAAPAGDHVSQYALDDVFATLLRHAGPKREAKARKELEAFASQMETYRGRHFPGPNVYPLRTTLSEMARQDEAQRRERAELAASVRSLLGRYFSDGRA